MQKPNEPIQRVTKSSRFHRYDFGSFSIDYNMWFAFIEYWQARGILDEMRQAEIEGKVIDFKVQKRDRDYDPNFVQPLVAMLEELPGIIFPVGLPSAENLRKLSIKREQKF